MTRLGPSVTELDILDRKIGQEPNKPDLEVGTPVQYALIILLTLIMAFNYWRNNRIQTITFWVDIKEPEQNTHAFEISELSPPDANYIACFRIIQYPQLHIVSVNMPQGLHTIKLIMDNMWADIKNNLEACIKSDEFFDQIFYAKPLSMQGIGEAEFRHLNDKHQTLIDIQSQDIKKICVFRKIESFYMLYVPTYTRKPLITAEYNGIKNFNTV